MLTRHENGRLHVGVLFQEASNQCTDDCGTGTVCFRHMTERLKEVADKMQQLELQNEGLKKQLDELHVKWLARDEKEQERIQLIGDIVFCWKEQRAAIEADVPSGEFKEDDLRGARVSRAKKQLELILNRIAGISENRNDQAPKFEFCRHAFNIGMNCIREKGHGGPCR